MKKMIFHQRISKKEVTREGFGGDDLYQIGDCVMKANTGLCRIKDIVHLDGMGADRNKKYYLLIPFSMTRWKSMFL